MYYILNIDANIKIYFQSPISETYNKSNFDD